MISKVRSLVSGNTTMTGQLIRYLAVAFVGLGFDFGTLVLLHQVFGVFYLAAAAGGFSAGLVVNYFLSSKYVFSNPKIKSHAMNFGLFAVIGLVGLGILSLIMWALTGRLGINYVISKVVATIFVYAWNFFARRALYHNPQNDPEAQTA